MWPPDGVHSGWCDDPLIRGVETERSCARHNGLTELDLTDLPGGRTHRASPFPIKFRKRIRSGSLRETNSPEGRIRTLLPPLQEISGALSEGALYQSSEHPFLGNQHTVAQPFLAARASLKTTEIES
jgi:hypothetical protein